MTPPAELSRHREQMGKLHQNQVDEEDEYYDEEEDAQPEDQGTMQ